MRDKFYCYIVTGINRVSSLTSTRASKLGVSKNEIVALNRLLAKAINYFACHYWAAFLPNFRILTMEI